MNYPLSKKALFALAAAGILGALTPFQNLYAAMPTTHGESACTSSEGWTFSGAIPEAKRAEFTGSLRGKIAPVRGFSEALALRRFAQNNESRFLGEYWISRSLYDAKLIHIAFGGFVSIASRPVKAETAGIQLSAVECLLQIQNQFPAMALPPSVVERITELNAQAVTPQMHDIAWQAAGSALRAQLPVKAPPRRGSAIVRDEQVDSLLDVLKGSGAYETFALGLRAAYGGDHNTAVTQLDKFFAYPSVPPSLKRFSNTAHILMARELYSLQQFDRANTQLKHVTKSSNDLSIALEELSWAFLMNDRLSEAIGTAMNLNAGGLRHTYAPEAPMVMAMALNELCQYPESVRAIHSFKKGYEKSYQWLQKNISGNMYPDAVQFVRRAPGTTVPNRVASEWVRSPMFISSQDELNLLFDENEATTMLGRSGAREQTKIAENLMSRSRDLPARLRAAKKKMKEGDHLPSALIADMLALKDMILRYRRLQQGAPVWHTILANYQKSSPAIEKKLVSTINADLKARSVRMLSQLEEIAENIQLIEVEIYNGASQDIIWQNAHPDYKKMAQKMKEDRAETSSSKTWDWGRSPASDDDAGEVWEDELGSFNANLYDNCSSKDKYLAIKSGRLANKE